MNLTYFVAFVDQLVGAGDKLQAVDMIELSSDLVTEQPSSATWRDCPSTDIFRVTPDQIAESAFVRDLLRTSNDADLVECTNLWAQATMNAEHFAINNRSKDKEVEHLATAFPDRCIAVFLLTFLVKAVHLGDLARFMVTTNKSDAVRVSRKEVNVRW